MPDTISAMRGMKDILPDQSQNWQNLEQILAQCLNRYGYENIRTPLLEKSLVFKRTIGATTDIVEKEMYTWQDEDSDYISLRPEGTAGVARAMIEHHLLRAGVQKVWYLGAMFRRERPQKGRYRQFHQFGAETFTLTSAKIDAELIQISYEICQQLNLKPRLEINSLGSNSTRESYKKVLVDYLSDYKEQLDANSLKRLKHNPLRILDSKDSKTQAIIKNAPSILDYLDDDAKQHFDEVLAYLSYLNIPFVINAKLVRGLDYYNKTVFEWVDDNLGAQNTLCAGGRYDALFTALGGKPTAAMGFAMGLERLMLLVNQQVKPKNKKSVCFITHSQAADKLSLLLAQQLRMAIPDLIVYNNLENISLKSQFKRANKLSADYALILAENEITTNSIAIKPLKTDDKQIAIKQNDLITILKKYYKQNRM